MIMISRSSDQLRHDLWAQLERLDARLLQTELSHLEREETLRNRTRFQDLYDRLPPVLPFQRADREERSADSDLGRAWDQILGEAPERAAALPSY